MDNPVDKMVQRTALDQLGGKVPGDMSGGDVFSGLTQVLMGFMNGQSGSGSSTMSSSQYSNQQREQDFVKSVMNTSSGEDRRIPSMLQEAGTAVTGSRAGGDEWENAFKQLPEQIKSAILTAFNSSELGQLMGGDSSQMAMASIGMLKGTNEFTTPGGLQLGGQFSSKRKALAGDINKELMSEFVDPDTGLPIMDKTQGQSFENIGKFAQTMASEGGLSPKELIKSIDSESGAVELDKSALDGAQTNIKKGMELFRNLSDVFGSNDFNELMSQAQRLGGLNMSDPSSIGKTLSAVRNARGVARSVGLDERKALGDLGLANDTMVQMGVDRRTAAAFNLSTFAGAATQGQSNTQNISPFDSGFRKRLGSSEMIQQAGMSNTQMLAEAEANPHGEVAMAQAARIFFSKPGREDQFSPELIKKKNDALNEKDPAKREQKLREVMSNIKTESGIDVLSQVKEQGLSNLRETADSDTLDAMAEDNFQILQSRNKNRFRENYMRHEFNTGRMRAELGEGHELIDDVNEFEDLLTNAPDTVGLEKMSHLLAISEGRDEEITFYDSESKSYITKSAKEMTPDERRKSINSQLVAEGVDVGEAKTLTDSIMKAPQTLDSVEKETGMRLNNASKGAANLNENLGSEMSAFRLSKSARDRGALAGEQGAKELRGGPAMTDPLQNALFGFLGQNIQAEKDQAFRDLEEAGDFATDSIDINSLSTTATQKELFSDISDTTDPEKLKEISKRKNTKTAMNDLAQRIIPELQDFKVKNKDGEDVGLAEQILADQGFEDPAALLEKYRLDMAEAIELESQGKDEEAAALREKNLAVTGALLGELGGSGGSAPMGVLKTLKDAGHATNVRKETSEDRKKEIAELEEKIGMDSLDELNEGKDKLDSLDELDEQRKLVENLRAESEGKIDEGKLGEADMLRESANNLLTDEDKALLAGEEPQDVKMARLRLEKGNAQDGDEELIAEHDKKKAAAEAKMAQRDKDLAAADELDAAGGRESKDKLSAEEKELADMEAEFGGIDREELQESVDALEGGIDQDAVDRREELLAQGEDDRFLLDVAEGGAEDVEKRRAFNRNIDVKKGKRLLDLKKDLGIDDIDTTKLEEGLESGEEDNVTGIDKLSDELITGDALGQKGEEDADLISRLASGGEDAEEVMGGLKQFGMGAKDVRKDLQEADSMVREEMKNTEDKESAGFKALENRLKEIAEAQKNVNASFTSDDTPGLLVELIDKMSTLIGGGTTLPVTLKN